MTSPVEGPAGSAQVRISVTAQQMWWAVLLGSALFTVLGLLVSFTYYVLRPSASWVYDVLPMGDMAGDDTAQTWWAASTLLLCAAFAAANGHRAAPARRYWLSLSVLLAAMSVDEVARGHERLGHVASGALGNLSGPFFYAWVVLALPLLAVLALPFGRLALSLPRSSRNRLLLAVAVYLAGGLGMEMVNAAYDSAHGNSSPLVYSLSTVLEETLEMAGVALLLRALLLNLPGVVVRLHVDGGVRSPAQVELDQEPRVRQQHDA